MGQMPGAAELLASALPHGEAAAKMWAAVRAFRVDYQQLSSMLHTFPL